MQPLSRRLAASPTRSWPDHPVPIALVITDLDVGGAERVLATLATRIDRRRWHPCVLALGDEGALAAPLREAGVDTECLAVNPRRPIQAVAKLARALRKRRPWLVQSFLFHANFASRWAALGAGRPWVIGGLRVAEREKAWHYKLDRATSSLLVGEICVSQGVLRFSRDVAQISPERLMVIPNGIDTDPYDRAAPVPRSTLGVPEKAPLAIFVGRLESQKAPDVLLDAAEQVVSSVPDWHLLIVGDGPDREKLLRRVESHPLLSSHVHWLGPRDDIPALLKTADVLVLPSLWEGMPNVILEAMAAGRAVVATQVEGSEDLVVPGSTGWLVKPGSATELAQALLEATLRPEQTSFYGQAGRARVEAEFTLTKMIESYERIWSQVLGYHWDESPKVDLSSEVLSEFIAKPGKMRQT